MTGGPSRPRPAPARPPRAGVTATAWRVLRNDPVAYALSWVQWVGFHLSPLAVGWVAGAVLDRLTTSASVPWVGLAALVGVEVARWTLLVSAAVQWHGAFLGWVTLPRVNMLRSVTGRPGPVPGRLPGSPGEAVSRFRDDAQDLGLVLDVWLDVSGAVLAAAVAVVVIATVHPLAAVATVVPVAVAVGVAAWFGPALRRWRRAAREATAAVTAFVGDVFGGITTIRTTGAEHAVAARFDDLNRRRAGVSRRDQVGTELVRRLGYGTGGVTLGIVLVVVAPGLRSGSVSVGDVAVLASYVSVVAQLPKWVARLGTYHRQAEVSVERMAALTGPDGPGGLVARRHLPLRRPRATPPPPAPGPEPFDVLEVEGLTVHHPGGGGISDVDLVVPAGAFVVVTGPVGAGKSTLVRAVLGLVAAERGTLRWDGRPVEEPSEWMVPPRVAYLPQVPRLFSEPLADTVLLGWPDGGLEEALDLAVLTDDLARMEAGVRTPVGPRGHRLSGGQIQRVALARAVVRRPRLLVVDDLSSALDPATERELWRRVRTRIPTALVVSNRPGIVATADVVVRLEGGRRVG